MDRLDSPSCLDLDTLMFPWNESFSATEARLLRRIGYIRLPDESGEDRDAGSEPQAIEHATRQPPPLSPRPPRPPRPSSSSPNPLSPRPTSRLFSRLKAGFKLSTTSAPSPGSQLSHFCGATDSERQLYQHLSYLVYECRMPLSEATHCIHNPALLQTYLLKWGTNYRLF
jgi:hypothetical protein